MASIVARNLSDQIFDLVRERIVSGQVPADLPIRQDSLAAELGVSKIPLREALARLEQEGLLRSHPNRGFFVRGLTQEEAEEVYALRLKLEPDAVALAATRAGEEDRKTAREMLDGLDRLTHDHRSAVGAANRAFHLSLIRPSGQLVTINILERLQVLSERYVHKHLEPLGRDERANEEHRELLDAWLARDGAAVGQLTSAHIQRTIDDLRKQLAR